MTPDINQLRRDLGLVAQPRTQSPVYAQAPRAHSVHRSGNSSGLASSSSHVGLWLFAILGIALGIWWFAGPICLFAAEVWGWICAVCSFVFTVACWIVGIGFALFALSAIND